MSHEEKVLNYIDSNKDEIISFMQKLIQTKSVTGNESEIAKFVAEESKKDGLEVELFEPAPNRISTIARYTGTTGKPHLMAYSHYDVVPPGDPKTWKHPPFSATIADGKIWGRGTSDNKIATCGLIMAFRALKKNGIKLKGNLTFTHVADEEKGGKFGFRNMLDRGYAEGVDYLFYGHGGVKEFIGVAANGSSNMHITVKGKAAHTSRLENGVNAINKACKLATRLKKLGDEVNLRRYPLPGTETVMMSRFSLNKFEGYVANNSVPDAVKMIVDRRYTPAESLEQAGEEIQKVIDELKAEDPDFDADLVVEGRMDLSVSPPDSKIVKSIQRSAEKLVGMVPRPRGGSHSSDHGHFVTLHHKPVASYGIGGSGGHMANENTNVEDVITTTKVYALILMDLLGVAPA
jgi:succinyl-diaminopimelate desuccinylase